MYDTKKELIRLVNLVPKGKVIYYGQLANLLGITAKRVGWILSGMKQDEWKLLPWWRVVAKNGHVSSLKLGQKGIVQLDLLTQEGIDVSDEHVSMEKHMFDLLSVVRKDTL